MYKVFKRSWYRINPSWPDGLEPHAGTKRHVRSGLTREEARAFCQTENAKNDPGKTSIKCEFEREG